MERVRHLAHAVRVYLWPPLLPPEELPDLPAGVAGAEVVFGYARQMLDAQYKAYEALDTKAATVIGGTLLLIGLLVPDVRPLTWVHWLVGGLLVLTIGYALATAFRAYSVSDIEYGVTEDSLITSIEYQTAEVQAAFAWEAASSLANNTPNVQRKAQFVQASLRALVLTPLLLGVLYVSGAFPAVQSPRDASNPRPSAAEARPNTGASCSAQPTAGAGTDPSDSPKCGE